MVHTTHIKRSYSFRIVPYQVKTHHTTTAKRAPIPPTTRAAACVAVAAAFGDDVEDDEDDAALAGRDEDALAGEVELAGVVGRLLPAADDTALPLVGTAEETDGTPDPLTAELGATTELAGLISDPEGAAEETTVDEVCHPTGS